MGDPCAKSALVEVYHSKWSKSYQREGRTSDQHGVYVTAAWLRQADKSDSLGRFLKTDMLPGEYHIAQVEGWILGVMKSSIDVWAFAD